MKLSPHFRLTVAFAAMICLVWPLSGCDFLGKVTGTDETVKVVPEVFPVVMAGPGFFVKSIGPCQRFDDAGTIQCDYATVKADICSTIVINNIEATDDIHIDALTGSTVIIKNVLKCNRLFIDARWNSTIIVEKITQVNLLNAGAYSASTVHIKEARVLGGTDLSVYYTSTVIVDNGHLTDHPRFIGGFVGVSETCKSRIMLNGQEQNYLPFSFYVHQ